MDARTRDLALLGFLSLFCAVSAWAGDRDVVGSFFFAQEKPRREAGAKAGDVSLRKP
jgi:hypothetical protein